MRVVIDTNVLLNCIGARTKHHKIWMAFLSEKISICTCSEILLEYEELVFKRYPFNAAIQIFDILSDPDYVLQFEIYYCWNVITSDPDDNKFFDTSVAANADYLITNDRHFNEVKRLNFPKVNIISADEFLQILDSLPDQ